MKINLWKLCLMTGAASLLAGCAPTRITPMQQHTGALARPDRVYVYNYAVSPDEVQLDTGLTAKIEDLVHKTSRTDEEKTIGRKVSDALAQHLVKEIQAMGYQANRAAGAPPKDGTVLAVQGQLLSVNEGNQTERVIIGLGMGRTDVKTITQVYDIRNSTRTLASEFETDAKSGFKPGAVETMGAGAAAGTLATSAAVSGGLDVVSEKYSATVEADADRTAKEIVKQLKQYFIKQGWILE